MTTQCLSGYFSQEAADLYGTSIYADANGKEVEVTAVGPQEWFDKGNYKNWKDAVCVSILLVKYVRQGRPGLDEAFFWNDTIKYGVPSESDWPLEDDEPEESDEPIYGER